MAGTLFFSFFHNFAHSLMVWKLNSNNNSNNTLMGDSEVVIQEFHLKHEKSKEKNKGNREENEADVSIVCSSKSVSPGYPLFLYEKPL